jgi:hypothetical protein
MAENEVSGINAGADNPVSRTRTRVSKTASTASDTARKMTRAKRAVIVQDDTPARAQPLTENEMKARAFKKYSTTTFGFNSRVAYSGMGSVDVSGSSQGNFYSPQLSTDFLEKPQNLRERRAWYRTFYNGNEFVGQAIDLHSTLPISKIKLDKPKSENQDFADYIYDFYVDMCNDLKLTKVLLETSHEYHLMGNAFLYNEDHDPYSKVDEVGKEALKETGRARTKELYEKFKIIDKDPNYKGFRKIIILPPDQVRIKKIPLSDESLIEFVPDPETKKTILGMVEGNPLSYDYRISDIDKQKIQEDLPEVLYEKLKDGGAIPLDTDPNSGSHCYHLSRKKSQYETMGVSILERCVNTLLYQDKLRQSQTSIASRHMTPIRVIWAEGMSDNDTDVLREQVDLALVDPDFSLISNFEIHWEEMGSNGRLLELSSEFEHIENALFAGLGVTRELLTGEGTYSGNKINLEILNTQYLLFREQLIEYVENNIFKPVAVKKGFEETDKFGRKKLLYPHLSFSRLAVRDNDAFFDQAFNMFNKGSLSVDIIHDIMNIDTHTNKKKIEADLFTVNDANFNQFLQNLYTSLGTVIAEKYDISDKLAAYLGLKQLPQPVENAEGGEAGGGLPGMGRFSSSLGKDKQAALMKIMEAALKHPEKLDKISKFLNGNGTNA